MAPGPEDDEDLPEAPDAAAAGEAGDGGSRRAFTDTVRKAVLTGLGAVFLTEEGARKVARDWKLPKEIVGYIAGQAGSAKDEIVRVVSEEVRKFFESEALRREFLRLVTSMSIEVHAEIRLKPDRHGKVEPHVKVASVKPRVAPRRRGEEHGGEQGEE
ncbi:hypothetical protein [Anaeromyxobacter diazotrophicus]|uniref:Uncharacterized protein n=1 Tax=Anaeromyxobacter diazotrophicus TaxID=2590199 RepID=A0A7I9VM07_9BACT|nr:hypothetical protein [Anaeromyxobacter diazotrophicus]GEJ57435.1 hypothetical protein AMYX_21760 [Anaeromyxobacter diazotrophicus]